MLWLGQSVTVLDSWGSERAGAGARARLCVRWWWCCGVIYHTNIGAVGVLAGLTLASIASLIHSAGPLDLSETKTVHAAAGGRHISSTNGRTRA